MIIQNLSNAFRQTGAGFTLEWTRALVVVSARNDQIWWVIRWKVTKQTRSSCYWGSGLFYVSHTWSRNDEVACKPVETYLLSNARGWAGWRTMLRLQIQRWSLSLDLLWRPGCFLWSTWEPEFDPADHSCPWLPGLLCLETLDWWKQRKTDTNFTSERHWFHLDVFVFVKTVRSSFVSRHEISLNCDLHCLTEFNCWN